MKAINHDFYLFAEHLFRCVNKSIIHIGPYALLYTHLVLYCLPLLTKYVLHRNSCRNSSECTTITAESSSVSHHNRDTDISQDANGCRFSCQELINVLRCSRDHIHTRWSSSCHM